MKPGTCLISVVLPLYNESAVLHRLYHGVIENLAPTGCDVEIIFVNDGSTDDSREICDQLAAADARVTVLHLSRNFGHQAAVQAGLARTRGDAVIVMDSDLQDDPKCLPSFVKRWRDGFEVVYAVRTKRKENLIKRVLFFSFYRFLNAISKHKIPLDAGNFGLIDRKVVQRLLELKEFDRFYPGLRHWVGFRQTGLSVERAPRYDDRPRVSMLGLFRLAKTALFSFSSTPLAIFYGLAIASALVCVTCTGLVISQTLFAGFEVPAWTSTVMIASFFGAQNALGIAILGEYIFRTYDEVRGRPKYIVAEEVNSESSRDLNSETQIINEIESLSREIGNPRTLPLTLTSADSIHKVMPNANG